MFVGQSFSGPGSRVRTGCCSSEQDHVTVPAPVVQDSNIRISLSRGVSSSLSLKESNFELQSDTVAEGTTEDSQVGESTAQNISFLEKPSTYNVGFSSNLPAESYADATHGVDLKDFLSRPVLINSYTWNESDAVGTTTTINPWQLYFNNTIIKNKLTNYAWLKCDLKIKILVNASPFYFGTTLVSYQPLPNFHPNSITNDAGTRYFIPYSQRPHIWIYPQNNAGGELTLPFLWPKNWISTISNQDFIDMGNLTYFPVAMLASANGATGTGVVISTYAWAENVVVSGPTAGLMLQSDEYAQKPVSKMASAIAAAAKSLSRVPVIGKYATATQIGAEAVADVASRLGFSNPPVISNTEPVKINGIPPLAATEISYPFEKLTIDAKNELSVDPSLSGVPNIDELSIAHLVSKESYLCTFPWSTSNVGDDLLFNSAVTPVMFDITSATNPELFFTPMGWVSNMFQYWRGDVIFRFRFICSQYHRGRVRIIYDPSGSSAQNILNTTATQASVFNEIIDLTKDTNVEVRVPYQQALAWCQTFKATSTSQIPFTVGNGTIFNHVPGVSNGLLAVRVVTNLTAPVASSTIQCIVSVRGADNLEFAAPSDIYGRYSYFAPQSDQYEETESDSIIAGHSPSIPAPGRFLVNHGEQIVSLRQMLRRMQYARTNTINGNVSGNNQVYNYNFYRFLPSFGFDPTGFDSAKGLIVPASNFPFSSFAPTWLQFIMPAYIGVRGSVNYTVINDAPTAVLTTVNRRTASVLGQIQSGSVTQAIASDGNVTNFVRSLVFNYASSSGSAAASQYNTAALSYQLPMYSAYKFNVTTPGNYSQTISQDDSSRQAQTISYFKCRGTVTNQVMSHIYTGVGTDFSLIFFLNVPSMWVYSSDVTVN